MIADIKKLAYQWVTAEEKNVNVANDYYCQTRDVFETKNNKMFDVLIKQGVNENIVYLIYAIIGELGNNSFDHNLGDWPNIMGIFFGYYYNINKKSGLVIIADRGLGVLTTLKKAMPSLKNDQEALQIAFTKKISSRILENRGNGLKFVKQNIKDAKLHLEFQSGKARAVINCKMNINSLDNLIQGCLAILTF
ncbi:MAG: hypothetical protein AAB653_00265 [Patescibacteria group bacterium]